MRNNPSQQETKKKNKLNILNLIRSASPISQSQIAQKLHLQPSTVSNLVRELKTNGLIEVIGRGYNEGSVGKPTSLLSLTAEFASFSGIYVHQDYLVANLINFQGNILYTSSIQFDPYKPDAVVDLVIKEILRHAALSRNYQGCGITVSSIVNSKYDVSVSPDFPWSIPNFLREIRKGVPSRYPITVENDANCAALYIHKLFKSQHQNLLVFLYNHAHQSLGAGIIINGGLYRGLRGDAGEIYHQEKEDIGKSFSDYIIRLSTFLAPEQLVLVSDDPINASLPVRIHTYVVNSGRNFPVQILIDPDMPVKGAAYMITDKVIQSLV